MTRPASGPLHAFLLVFLFLGALPVLAEPTAEVRIGFDNLFIRYRYAPVQVEIRGLEGPASGSVRIRQYVGEDPGNPKVLSVEIYRGPIENRVYEATIPMYDPVLPLVAQVLDDAGLVLATAQQELRQAARGLPFPALVGTDEPLRPVQAVLGVNDLPRDWWAYDPLESLWLAEPLTDVAAWDAIGRWVISGGSLVLFSGTDFYQWDSPRTRDLIPLSTPTLEQTADGTYMLSGIVNANADVLLERDGLPLLIRQQRAGGMVTLVTTRLQDLDPEDLSAIAARVPRAQRWLSVDRITAEMLNQTRVLRPLYLFAPALVVVLSLGLILFHNRSRRRFWLHSGLFFVVVGVAAVGSGLYVNSPGQFVFQYDIKTEFHLQTAFGIDIASYGFFSLKPTVLSIAHVQGQFPIQSEFGTSARGLYGLESETHETTLPLPARTRRFVRIDGAGGSGHQLRVIEEDEARFAVRLDPEAPPSEALLIVDGLFYALPLPAPASGVSLGDLRQVSASAMTPVQSTLYLSVRDWLPLHQGPWLLTYAAHTETRDILEIPSEVSVRRIDVIEGRTS